ncbi:MAG: hypothetical protein H8D38_00480 [DPANN group archaeon]|nr:hypothetical protein [DPANN group archaeon]
MELDLKDIKIQNSEGNIVDLGDVKNLEELKRKIIDEIEFPYCKNCGFHPKCPIPENEKYDNCKLLEGVINRYIDMNIKSISYKNKYSLVEFVRSCYYFAHMSKDFLDLIGIYTDDHWNWFFESDHPHMNSLFSHKILIKLSKYIDSIRNVETRRLKKFSILVEGESDEIILKSILKSLGVLGIDFDIKNSVKFFILESKDRAKKDKIRSHLKRFRELDSEYFMFLDKDAEEIVNELIKEGLINKETVFFFENELEEEYPLNELIIKIESIKPELKDIFDIEDIKKELKNKPLKKILSDVAYKQNKSFNLDGVKIQLAKLFSEDISKELGESIIDDTGCHRGDWTPKSKNYSQIVEKIRPLVDKIKKISTAYFVVKKQED